VVGIDIHKFRSIEERADDYILSIGRFGDARKNIGLLFEAYALVRELMPSAPKLILAGMSAPPRETWDKAKNLCINENIVFKETVSDRELIELYQNAVVFVLTSDEEGLGIVLLEAMACATPVISTRCGGPNTVVSDEVGFLTPVGDAQSLAERILWMLQNPEQRRRMGQAGRNLVEARFSNEVVGKKYQDVYDKLLGADIP